ncbi:M24 family metallopeptidase [Halobacterium rubrum]|uniref:M24 family metallopeptidase n=1 Tax=Halobacterium TaxID=2239 RepID=UPI001F2A03F2|nr:MULTISPECIES: M24 family metallopeptidase [Halobacterium]MDH5020533.1 M24 family metallopeptidase [Halobacterium rubrum]
MRPGVFDSALADAGADAFVHAGPPGDPVVSYLTGAQLPCRAAVVYGGRVAVVPGRPLPEHVAVREDVTVLDPHPVPAERLPGLVADEVVAPRAIPHDAALYLEGDGVDISSTAAHERARRRKTDGELEALRDATEAAEVGLEAAAGLLADSDADANRLGADGEDVTAERVRRAANGAVAEAGATPETAVQPAGVVDPGEPLRVTVAGAVDGYRAPVFRTFVPDSDGGWDRRATLGCEYGVEAALEIVEPGETTAERAGEEATAELASLGFPPETTDVDVHGVGLQRREAPTGEDALVAGAVVSVTATARPDEANGGGEEAADDPGSVGVSDVAVVGENGAERVGSFPRSVVPKADY